MTNLIRPAPPADPLRTELYRLGVCPDCLEEMQHEVDAPFSHCKCGTSEDTTGPSVLQKLRDEVAKLPVISIRCEYKDELMTGVTHLDVIRVEREDDGSLTAITNHWPK